MKKSPIDCPVPIDQQPMNEYLNLKESLFFCWTTETLNTYIIYTIFLILCSQALVLPFIISSIPQIERINPINIVIYMNIFGNCLLILYFTRLYLGWLYVYDRLIKASVSYEESGWYDGQIWVKTPNLLIQDKLIAEYQIFPLLKRIKLTTLSLISIIIIGLAYIAL
ncbi:MAG: hypothetical protein RLZZ196_387 [Bacteroidota bacterium]|jgi:hypothetical protein